MKYILQYVAGAIHWLNGEFPGNALIIIIITGNFY